MLIPRQRRSVWAMREAAASTALAIAGAGTASAFGLDVSHGGLEVNLNHGDAVALSNVDITPPLNAVVPWTYSGHGFGDALASGLRTVANSDDGGLLIAVTDGRHPAGYMELWTPIR